MSSSRSNEERSGGQGYLPRGGACVSCRRRKMKCDGKHPVCTQCDRAGRTEDCEYTTGQERSTVQILEENISRLESRIRELQNPNTSQSTVPLRQPYGGAAVTAQTSPSSGSSPIQDPPRHLAENLVTAFLGYASQLGFFLNISRFRASFFASGHLLKPSPALISSTYLWAIRLSHDSSVKKHEIAYLERAIQDAATALSGNHPEKIVHAIQAEVLLATYFFSSGRFFEGKYHVTTAVSMVFSAGLHRIRSAAPQPTTTTGKINYLPPARDSTEEGERILALWTVLDLDKCWAVALEHAPNFEYSNHPLATKVDTPWPLEMEEFDQGRLPQHARTFNTIHNLLNGVQSPDLGVSIRAIEAKAAVLWDRVAVFMRKSSTNSSPQSMQPLIEEFTALSAILDSVIALLPSSDPRALGRVQNVDKARRLAVVYSILCVVTIRLHAPFALAGRSESSKRKRLGMARVVLELVLSLRERGGAYLNPIIGSLWVEAAQVIFDEIVFIRAMRASGALPAENLDDRAMMGLVHQATTAMADFSVNMPLTSFQVSKIQKTAQTL